MGKVKKKRQQRWICLPLMLEDKSLQPLDPNGFPSLSMGKMANGATVVYWNLCLEDARHLIPLNQARSSSTITHLTTDYTTDTVCSMEYTYFASSWFKESMAFKACKCMGLTGTQFKHEADIVVGKLHSSLSAAMICRRIRLAKWNGQKPIHSNQHKNYVSKLMKLSAIRCC